MYMNKDDWTYIQAHVDSGHRSSYLLRALYAAALWTTVETVGAKPLLHLSQSDIKSMNSIANK